MNILNKTNLFILLLALTIAPSAGFAQVTPENVMSNTQTMEKVLEQVKKAYQANPKKGPAAVQSLTQSQSQWKQATVKACQGGAPEKSTECMNRLVLERTKALQSMLAAPK